MHGPRPRGFWTAQKAPNAGSRYEHLEAGHPYRVLRPFQDFDGELHPEGETWIFLGYSFLPYDDGLSLFVSLDGEREWQLRLQDRPSAQGPVVAALAEHLEAVGPKLP